MPEVTFFSATHESAEIARPKVEKYGFSGGQEGYCING